MKVTGLGIAAGVMMMGFCQAATVEPTVAVGPDGSYAVRLEIDDHQGDDCWMQFSLPEEIDPSKVFEIYVGFNIYRETGDGKAENLYWQWQGDINPGFGTQWDHYGTMQPWTFPFDWLDPTYQHTPTIFDRYAFVEMVWDIENHEVHSWYDGSEIDISQPLKQVGTYLSAYRINLKHDAATGSGAEVVWIDDVEIVMDAGDIIYLHYFDDLDLGPLNGQGGWQAGTYIPRRSLADFADFAQAWQTTPGQIGYDEKWDFVDNNLIDAADLQVFCETWLQ